MKSKRILQLILVCIVVIVVAVAGFLYFANSSETKQQEQIQADIDANRAILNKGLLEKAAKERESSELKNELTEAQALLNSIDFKDSAESIEYDGILFSISDETDLQIISLIATPPLEVQEGDVYYQITTFTIDVRGKAPGKILTTTQDSAEYNSDVMINILDYIHRIAVSDDFDSTSIQSVSIVAAITMTEEDIFKMIDKIYGLVLKEIPEAEIEGKTEAEIAALVTERLNNKTSSQIQALMDEAGLDRPSASITIKIWTYKEA